jgi:peptide/nickel transport system ATP-binding protein
MGLLPEGATTTGSMRLDGRELVALSDAEMGDLRGRRIAMIFQEPMTALNPLHTVGAQVAEPLRRHLGMGRRQARAEALRLLERVRLPQAAQRLDAYPAPVVRRAAPARDDRRALACAPDLLIADEPTTALDVTIQAEILDLIAELVQASGMALLLISHDLDVMAQNVERVMVMYGGTIAESGPTASVFDRLAHPYTRGLFGARPRLGAPRGTKLATIPAACPSSRTCRGAVRSPTAAAGASTSVASRRQAFRVRADHEARCFNMEPPP